MPNPSTLAAEEEAVSTEKASHPTPAAVKTIEALVAALENGDYNDAPHQPSVDVDVALDRIKELITYLERKPVNVTEMILEQDKRIEDLEAAIDLLKGDREEIQSVNLSLLDSMAAMGANHQAMQESRDRVLAENCVMTQKLRDLVKIGKAASRFLAARAVFEEATVATDAQTQEVAEAEGELETLIETHKSLLG